VFREVTIPVARWESQIVARRARNLPWERVSDPFSDAKWRAELDSTMGVKPIGRQTADARGARRT